MLSGLRRQCLLVALLLIPMSVPLPALAEKRVALVIGNGVYRANNLLGNPPNDARLIGQVLTKARFETIETKTDLGIAEFRQVLRRFQSQANGAEVAFVYFAGHGIEANGVNWLIPTDAELADERDLDYEAIKADLVLQALQGARMRVLVLDACRDNPFGRNWRASIRGTTSGLARLEADDVLVLFAAAPGRTASDGVGSNSPFAEALAKRLPEPGLAIQLLGGNVRDDVLAATGGNQRPYVSASITGTPFYLVPAIPAVTSSPLPTTSQSDWGAAEREWQQYGKDTKDIRLLEAFKEKHKNDPVYARLAESRIEELKRQQAALAVPERPQTEQPLVRTPPQPKSDTTNLEKQPIRLQYFWSTYSNCKSRPPATILIKQAPRYGKIEFRNEINRAKTALLGDVSKCLGTIQRSRAVYYQPVVTTETEDQVSFEARMHHGTLSYTCKINIAQRKSVCVRR